MVKLHIVTAFLSFLCITLGLASPTPHIIEPEYGGIAAQENQLRTRAVALWESYHDYDGARLSLAVWVQKSGPSWRAIHGVDGATYQSWFDNLKNQGYVSTLVSVTGSRDNPTYAGVMEQISGVTFLQKCDMAFNDFDLTSRQAFSEKKILKSFREYGVPTYRRWCAIYHSNPVINRWSWWPNMTYTDYKAVFDAFKLNQYWRPAAISVSEDQRITALFMDTSVGAWQAKHGLTAAQLDAEYQTQKANGLYSINICGGGVGSNARFTAIFAQQDVPLARVWTATGTTTGFKNNAASMATVDGIMETSMQANGVRQAQISIGRNGAVLMQRAYTWAEPGRYITQPAGIFLPASVSKMFVVAEVQSLFNNGKLNTTTKVYPRLGYTNPKDARLNDITVQQLLDHTGGYDFTLSKHQRVFMMREIALEQNVHPVGMKNIVDWAFKRNLDFTPGAREKYSNYGYLLLAYLVQHVTGQAYYDYLKTTFFTPSGLDIRQWATAASAHARDGIIQEASGIGLNALTPLSDYRVPWVYGGDGMVKEAAVGPSSLSASASTIMRFISKYGAKGNGPRAVSIRDGKMNGVRTWAQSRSDNVDWALNLNTMGFATGVEDDTNPLFNKLCLTDINNFLNTNPIA